MKSEPIDPKRLTAAQRAIYVAHRPDPLPDGMTAGDADAEVQRVLTREGIPWAPVAYTPIDPACLTPEQREVWDMLEMGEPPSSGTRAWADLQFCYVLEVFYGLPLEPPHPGTATSRHGSARIETWTRPRASPPVRSASSRSCSPRAESERAWLLLPKL
jgi:hypothetical protein